MINNKTLTKLQYFDILQAVSAFCVSSVAKNKTLALLPANTFEDALQLVEETKQAYDLFRFESSFDLSVDGIEDVCNLARVGSALSMGQLLQVMRTLRTARNLQASLFKDYGVEIPLLQAKAYQLYTDKQLEEDIDFAILSEEEMNDKASSELFAIRKRIKGIKQ